jgi:hypothetical protein
MGSSDGKRTGLLGRLHGKVDRRRERCVEKARFSVDAKRERARSGEPARHQAPGPLPKVSREGRSASHASDLGPILR